MPDTSDELDHILDVLCDDPALLSTPEERGIAAVGYHNIEEAKAALTEWRDKAIRAEMLDLMDNVDPFHTADWYVKLRQQVISRYGAEDGGDV